MISGQMISPMDLRAFASGPGGKYLVLTMGGPFRSLYSALDGIFATTRPIRWRDGHKALREAGTG